jgi:hypothetical protein
VPLIYGWIDQINRFTARQCGSSRTPQIYWVSRGTADMFIKPNTFVSEMSMQRTPLSLEQIAMESSAVYWASFLRVTHLMFLTCYLFAICTPRGARENCNIFPPSHCPAVVALTIKEPNMATPTKPTSVPRADSEWADAEDDDEVEEAPTIQVDSLDMASLSIDRENLDKPTTQGSPLPNADMFTQARLILTFW